MIKGGRWHGLSGVGTDRLELLHIGNHHTASFFNIMSRREATKCYEMSSLTEMGDAEKIESFRQTFESGRGIRWGIIMKETGAFIGTVRLNNLNLKSKKAEIGFELYPSYWNKAYVSEAVKGVLDIVSISLDYSVWMPLHFPKTLHPSICSNNRMEKAYSSLNLRIGSLSNSWCLAGEMTFYIF